MDYLNINLNNDHERNTNILYGYDLETLFLEISCNDIVTGKQIGRASCRERVSSPV